MRTPEFKYDRMVWDEFKKFHNNIGHHNMFVKFDDGSFMIRNGYLRIPQRKLYNEYGFRIVRSNDIACRGAKFFTPDGERVWTKALNNCELLWDVDTDKVYSLHSIWIPSFLNHQTKRREAYTGPNVSDLLPDYIRSHGSRVRFFMHGDGRVVSMPVEYTVKREYNEEQQEYLKTTTQMCKAWSAMVERKNPLWNYESSTPEQLNWRTFNHLTEHERHGIAAHGFKIPIDTKTVRYLRIEKK